MLKKYFLRKALRKALVNLSTSDQAHFESFKKVYEGTKDLLVDLSMSQDEIQMRVGLNTALIADLQNLRIQQANLKALIEDLDQSIYERKKYLEELELTEANQTQNQNG